MTRIVVVGGAGRIGQAAVQTLVDRSLADDLVVADQNLAEARDLVDRIGAPELSAVAVDVRDPELVSAALVDTDVVLVTSTTDDAVPIVAEVALAQGVNFVDTSDDVSLITAQLEFSDRFAAAGLRGVTGMGVSPGMLNLLAVEATEHMTRIDEIILGVRLEVLEELPEEGELLDHAVLRHWIQRVAMPAVGVSEGLLVELEQLAPVAVAVGEEAGVGWTVRRPEPVTLRRHGGEVGSIQSLLFGSPLTIAFLQQLRDDLIEGWLTIQQAVEEVLTPSPTRRSKATVMSETIPGPGNLPGFFAQASGVDVSGGPSKVTASLRSLPSGSGEAAAVPGVLAIEQILDRTTPPGMWPPEAGVDRHRLLADLVPYCDRVGSVAELLVVEHDGTIDLSEPVATETA